MQPTTPKDERASPLRPDALELKLRLFTDPQLFAEPDASRFGGEKRVGTTLDEEAIEALGHDLAAEAIVRLDERHPRPGRRIRLHVHVQEAVRRGKTSDASAKHDHMAGCQGFRQPAQIAVHPPSTVRAVPVIIRAAGPARKVIAAATSSGVASLPAGVRPRMSLLIASFSSKT